MEQFPRLLHLVGPPLGLYFRPGRNDHRALLQPISDGHASPTGVVFSPTLLGRQEELRTESKSRHLDCILDTCALELATPAGRQRQDLAALPWASTASLVSDEIGTAEIEEMTTRIAEFVARNSFSAVLAPTHYVTGAFDPWLDIDARVTVALRRKLDSLQLRAVPIYYLLSLPMKALRDPQHRTSILGRLQPLPFDALWLRAHPFGSSSSGPSLAGYIAAAWDLTALQRPIIAERSGTIGLALLAFGAAGGIECGITMGEQFNVRPLLKRNRSGAGFVPSPRVYLPELGAYLSRSKARSFFETRQMKSRFACTDESCCRHGYEDMIRDPRRHFIVQRCAEVRRLSAVPEPMRAASYLDRFLRPATDLAVRAAKVEPSLVSVKERLESWRYTLGSLDQTNARFSSVPEGKRIGSRFRA